MTEQCEVVYVRQLTGPYVPGEVENVRCTYIADHAKTTHSWSTLKMQDDEDQRARAAKTTSVIGDDTLGDIQVLLDNITAGNADPYLEAILAITHNRKRTLRGVRGFGRL